MVGQWLFGLNENRGEMLAEPVSPPDHYYIQESYLTTSLRGLLLSECLLYHKLKCLGILTTTVP
ncbi:hypothetical protein E2C01_094524 [Portunus trituberculatus]|uniref:Uncharacterized protein n=1 Tax=Portunus trituberculatus TaxID=210409 RepID=A0A5B7K1W3_PORTR|nr:hypothetical protein [Portunus trituberculatus]